MPEKTEKTKKPKLRPVDDDEAEELAGDEKSLDEIPEGWAQLDLEGMRAEGWKPYLKTQGEHQYINLRYRKGKEDQQKSLGRYSDERWKYIESIFGPPKSHSSPTSPSPLMRSAIIKTIPSSVRFTAEVMQWYWWAAEKAQKVLGNELTFEEFLNDTVLSYFAEKNMYLAVQIGASEQSVGIQ